MPSTIVIADDHGQLYLSVRTVETHRAHIQQKLGRTTRAELVRYALDHGLLDP
jgi:two-component system response regulator NreC